MIYGINFNGQPIPDGVKKLFPSEMKRYRCGNCDGEIAHRGIRLGQAATCKTCGRHETWRLVRGLRALLVGVGQSEEERDMMVIQMTNGHRMVHVEPKQTAGGVWYGFYS